MLVLYIHVLQVAHDIQGIAVGAVLSDYQRVRVENVCSRLGITCLAYLWSCDQMELLHEMISCDMQAVLVKTACIGEYMLHGVSYYLLTVQYWPRLVNGNVFIKVDGGIHFIEQILKTVVIFSQIVELIMIMCDDLE